MNESQNTAVVTGASRGIGRAIALRLSATHHIVAAARSRPELDSLAAEIQARGGSCDVVELDIRKPDRVAAALDGVRADVLVNNAGVGYLKPFLELTADEWNTMVDVNFLSLIHISEPTRLLSISYAVFC